MTEFVEWLTGTHKCDCGAKYNVAVTEAPTENAICQKCGTVMDSQSNKSFLTYERMPGDEWPTPTTPEDPNQLAKAISLPPMEHSRLAFRREPRLTKKPPGLNRGFFSASKEPSRAYGSPSRQPGFNTPLIGVVCAIRLSTDLFLRGGRIDGDHVYRGNETARDRARRARRQAARSRGRKCFPMQGLQRRVIACRMGQGLLVIEHRGEIAHIKPTAAGFVSEAGRQEVSS
jgi:hypothetical protein